MVVEGEGANCKLEIIGLAAADECVDQVHRSRSYSSSCANHYSKEKFVKISTIRLEGADLGFISNPITFLDETIRCRDTVSSKIKALSRSRI
jgi:hypothetical protein